MNYRSTRIAFVVALLFSGSSLAQYDDNSECEEAKDTAESAASDLESYARRLQQCASNADLSYDCSSEFNRVRSAYSDYESAISDVSSYCDD